MGYRIQYGPMSKIHRSEIQKSGTVALTGMFFLVFLIMVNLLWEEGVQVIRESILPNTSMVTAAAVEDMSDALAQENTLFDSVKAFLKSILYDGFKYTD